MTITPRARWLLAFAVAAVAVACHAETTPRGRDEGRLGTVEVFASRQTHSGLVFLFSDADGWTPALEDAAQRLATSGAIVVGVDLRRYLEGLARSTDGCHYVVAELEDLSHRLEREHDFLSYHSPVLVGLGAGATLAYAALAQAPSATIAGAAGLDPAPALGTRVPLCAGAVSTPDPHGGFRYATDVVLPGPWRVNAVRGSDVAAELVAIVAPMLAPPPTSGSLVPALPDLPIVELPASVPGPLVAVIYSGDGGWRDLDKAIGQALAERGVPVVGVDSLRYFWHAKTPKRVAADLAAIMSAARAAWGDVRFVLVGYSFGAGILPFAVNRLPPTDRARIVEVSLLGLEARAPFQIEVAGWLGRAPSESAPLVLPEIRRLDPDLGQCFYGEEEAESLCRDSAMARWEVVRTAGGHHFDGDYVGLAERVLAGARRRLAAKHGSASDDAAHAAGDQSRDVGEHEGERETAR